jgi:hypothetical protein
LTGSNPQASRYSNNESNVLPTQLKESTAKTQRLQKKLVFADSFPKWSNRCDAASTVPSVLMTFVSSWCVDVDVLMTVFMTCWCRCWCWCVDDRVGVLMLMIELMYWCLC